MISVSGLRFWSRKKVDILVDGRGDMFYIGPDEETFPDGSRLVMLRGSGFKGTYKFRAGEIIEPVSKNKKKNFYMAPMAAVKDNKQLQNFENPIIRLVYKVMEQSQIINLLSRAITRSEARASKVAGDSGRQVGELVDLVAEINRATKQLPSESSMPMIASPRPMEEEE